MEHLAALVRWIITYSLSGGFWHFAGVYLIVCAITRIFRLVKVNVSRTERKREG